MIAERYRSIFVSTSTSPRTPSGYREIAEVLRRQIVRGVIKPGQLLPTRLKLRKQFRTTSVTIQNALDVLAEDGLVRAEGRRGTFVQENPPHLSEYALVIPSAPWKLTLWSRLYATLLNEAAAISESGQRRFLPFYGMDWQTRSRDYPPLLERVQSGRLAGILFATHPWRLIETPVLDKPGIPRVALMSGPGMPHVAKVAFDGSFWKKALDYFAARGRKRIALISTSVRDSLREIQPLLSARGMTMRGTWMMPVSPQTPEGARTFIQLMWDARGERPDALVIADDNLIEEATAGLAATGVRVGEELEVIAHCNFPWLGPTPLPLKRLGFDIRSVLWTCIDLLDRQRRGESVPAQTNIEALFEEELQRAPRSPDGEATSIYAPHLDAGPAGPT
jgi:DNA-binding LacI/PurR family transcriptional regulator